MSNAFFSMSTRNSIQNKRYSNSRLFEASKKEMSLMRKEFVSVKNTVTGKNEVIHKDLFDRNIYVGITKGSVCSEESKQIKRDSNKNQFIVLDNRDNLKKRINKEDFNSEYHEHVHKGKITVFDKIENKNKMIYSDEYYSNKDRYIPRGSKGIKEFTPEIKKKMSLSNLNTQIHTCDWCNKEKLSPSNLKQFHNENCIFHPTFGEQNKLNRKGKNKGQLPIIVSCPYCNKTGSKSTMSRWHFDNCKLRDR